jgi:hypothetical protein
MSTILLAAVEQVATDVDKADAFRQGLQVSGIALLGIFAVMALFALMIVVLTNLFPGGNDNS